MYRSELISKKCVLCDKDKFYVDKNLRRHLREVHGIKEDNLGKYLIPKTQKKLDFHYFGGEKMELEIFGAKYTELEKYLFQPCGVAIASNHVVYIVFSRENVV